MAPKQAQRLVFERHAAQLERGVPTVAADAGDLVGRALKAVERARGPRTR